jgi:hypothetical protein
MIEIFGNINVESVSSVGAISSGNIYTIENYREIIAEKNNISADFSSIINNKNDVGTYVSKPFIIGSSKLGSGYTFATKVNYFIGKKLCDEKGNFDNPYLIRLIGSSYNFTIIFNTFSNEYPKSVNVSGKDYYLSSPILQVSQPMEAGNIEIKFDSWNIPNRPIIIEKIYDGVSLDINKRNLLSFSADSMQRENAELPSWGIISNKGNIELKDFDKRIYSLAKNKLLKSDSLCYMSLRNTLFKGKNERIATMYTDSWEYDRENYIAKVSLKDDLEEWQDINISAIDYDYTKSQYYPMSDIYIKLHSLTPRKYNMIGYENLSERTKTILANTKIYYPFLKSSSLWNAWYKLCQVCQLYIYKNALNETICDYEFGA